jgi:hypothetical protein
MESFNPNIVENFINNGLNLNNSDDYNNSNDNYKGILNNNENNNNYNYNNKGKTKEKGILYQSPSNKGNSNLNNLDNNLDINLNLNPLQNLNIGPNVNIKFPKTINRSSEQIEFFKRKICKTKKTELCKNWELFGDCFYKDKCSFAHGESELRNKISTKNDENEKYKTKPCRSFLEKGYCSFGNRCQYTHIVSQYRLLSYKALNIKKAYGILFEALKNDNEQFEFEKILDNATMNYNSNVIM